MKLNVKDTCGFFVGGFLPLLSFCNFCLQAASTSGSEGRIVGFTYQHGMSKLNPITVKPRTEVTTSPPPEEPKAQSFTQTYDSGLGKPFNSFDGPEVDSTPERAQERFIERPLQFSPEEVKVTIVVCGRSGSGVTSTIRELIGPKTTCTMPQGNETLSDIMEYTVTHNDTSSNRIYRIKFVDIPGLVDGRLINADAQILATFKSYITRVGPPLPQFYLALSRFDDNRIDGEHSLFVQFIKRLERFQKVFLDTVEHQQNPIVFLLTRLMSETKLNQRRPRNKIESFENVIKKYANFSSPFSVIVGENKAVSEYEVKVEGGYYRLPNKQYYPKNIWEEFIKLTNTSNERQLDLLRSFMENRETEMECQARLINTDWDQYEEDADAFEYLLKHPDAEVEGTEVNSQIDNTFSDRIPQRKVEEVVQKVALQVRLQDDGITQIENIPTSYEERTKFFQKSVLFSGTIPALILDEAFNLTMPEYILPLTVGYGYAVMADEISPKSPFKLGKYLPTAVGYQFPNFMKCRRFPVLDVENIMEYSKNLEEYVQKRLQWLQFPFRDNVSIPDFSGKVKEGFNVPPEEGVSIASLTAVREIRALKCTLSRSSFAQLDDEFLADFEDLPKLDLHKKEVVNEWINFFNTYGSHIVTKGYGGGSIRGTVFSENLWNVMKSRDETEGALKKILEFEPLQNSDSAAYSLTGGEMPEPEILQEIQNMPEERRDSVLQNWTSSLSLNFVMLKTEFVLKPISHVLKRNNYEDGEKVKMLERAIRQYLSGELKYVRKQKKQQGNRARGSTPKPEESTRKSPENNNGPFTTAPTTQMEVALPTNSPRTPQPTYAVVPSLWDLPSWPDENNPVEESSSYETTETYSYSRPIPEDVERTITTSFNVTSALSSILNKTLDTTAREDERRYESERRYREKMRQQLRKRSQDQLSEMHKEVESKIKELEASRKAEIQRVRQEGRIEEEMHQKNLEKLRYQNEIAEKQHRLFMLQLQIRREQEERERKKKEQCSSWLGCAWNTVTG